MTNQPDQHGTDSDCVVEVRDLVMRYGDKTVVDHIDMDLYRGEILAFLGPNGAGKTTTVEILEGYRSRTSGTVSVLGVDPGNAPRDWREQVGVVLQESEPYPELTVAETIEMHGRYYRNARPCGEVVEMVGLTDAANQRCRRLSGGQRRRLDLGLALVGDPEVVFLDEPTTGFDPNARREAWEMIRSLREYGKTALLTTHYMEEAEQLADRILVISQGHIVAQGTTEELASLVHIEPVISWEIVGDTPTVPDKFSQNQAGQQFTMETKDVTSDLHALTGWALEQQVELVDLNVKHPSLEDVYLALVGTQPTATEEPSQESTRRRSRASRRAK